MSALVLCLDLAFHKVTRYGKEELPLPYTSKKGDWIRCAILTGEQELDSFLFWLQPGQEFPREN